MDKESLDIPKLRKKVKVIRTEKLERFQKVDPREIWKTEPKFTKWLRENIKLLSEELGLDLEVEELEAPVGEFSADILAKDLGTGKTVIMENQLEQTNHDHLGKVLTYAAGKDAGIVIWISPDFREEHLSALNWLNKNTTGDVSIFGVEIELLRIGDSNPAPRFHIVSRPSEWEKTIKAPAVSERATTYQEFFQGLANKLREQGFTTSKRGRPQNWFTMGLGRAGFCYSFVFTMDKRFKAELWIETGDIEINRGAFDFLKKDKEIIEKETGILYWDPPLEEGRRAARIAIYYPDKPLDIIELKKADRFDGLIDWAVDIGRKFNEVLTPRIMKFKS